MRRVIIEFAVSEVSSTLGDSLFEKIESMEVLSFLRSTTEEVAVICKIRLKDPMENIPEVFAGRFDEIQIIEKEGTSYTCFFKARRFGRRSGINPLGPGVYLSIPYEIEDGRLRGTFLGNAKEIRAVLQRIEEAGAKYRIVSMMDAKFLPDSPMGQLTEKQRKVILSAFRMGYYDVPRRVSSEELARRLNIREPTLVMHRRKAERRLLAAVVGEP